MVKLLEQKMKVGRLCAIEKSFPSSMGVFVAVSVLFCLFAWWFCFILETGIFLQMYGEVNYIT